MAMLMVPISMVDSFFDMGMPITIKMLAIVMHCLNNVVVDGLSTGIRHILSGLAKQIHARPA